MIKTTSIPDSTVIPFDVTVVRYFFSSECPSENELLLLTITEQNRPGSCTAKEDFEDGSGLFIVDLVQQVDVALRCALS